MANVEVSSVSGSFGLTWLLPVVFSCVTSGVAVGCGATLGAWDPPSQPYNSGARHRKTPRQSTRPVACVNAVGTRPTRPCLRVVGTGKQTTIGTLHTQMTYDAVSLVSMIQPLPEGYSSTTRN